MGKFNLLDLKFILTQRGEMAFGRGFPLRSWQEEILEREKNHSKCLGLFKKKRFSKTFLSSILILGDLQRNYHFSFEFCLQTNFPG